MYFANANALERLINAYFEHIKGEFHFEDISINYKTEEVTEKKKVWDRPAEPPTLSGLAHYLQFESCKAFDDYTANGQYSAMLKRAKLRIESMYEQKLHNGPASGAIFALKKMGWNQRNANTATGSGQDLNVNVFDSGPLVADNEKDVVI